MAAGFRVTWKAILGEVGGWEGKSSQSTAEGYWEVGEDDSHVVTPGRLLWYSCWASQTDTLATVAGHLGQTPWLLFAGHLRQTPWLLDLARPKHAAGLVK